MHPCVLQEDHSHRPLLLLVPKKDKHRTGVTRKKGHTYHLQDGYRLRIIPQDRRLSTLLGAARHATRVVGNRGHLPTLVEPLELFGGGCQDKQNRASILCQSPVGTGYTIGGSNAAVGATGVPRS